jgi:hypothetical protein
MPGIVNQHERRRTTESGADSSVSGRPRRGRIQSVESKGTIRVDRGHAATQDYDGLGRSGKGLVKRYIAKVTGLSRAQVTRLVGQYVANGVVQSQRGGGVRFTVRYTPEDIALLARGDFYENPEPGGTTPISAGGH